MKVLLIIILLPICLVSIGLAIFMWKVRKRMMAFRDAMENGVDDEEFQRMANKYYYRNKTDDSPHFEEGYFSGDPTGAHKKQQQKKKQKHTKVGGVTVIDDRDPSVAERKIFTHDEGEYVDFKEV